MRKNDSCLRSILQIGAHINFQFVALRSGRFRLTSPVLISLYPRGLARVSALPVFLYSLGLCNRIVLEGERDTRLWRFMIQWAEHISHDEAIRFAEDTRNQSIRETSALIGDAFSMDIFSRAHLWFLGNFLVILGHVSAEDERYFSKSFSSFVADGYSVIAREKREKIERAYVRYCGVSLANYDGRAHML